jgi:L-threonylcarbamoyladenylate synthase
MKLIDLDKENISKASTIILDYLKNGEVVILPTDTIDGLSVRADDKKGVEKIYSIKKRGKNKPLLVLVSSMAMLKKYCYLNKIQEKKLKEIWQESRPSSVILKHRNLLSSNITHNNSYLAVRLPKSVFLRKMIRALGVPIVSTSVNISGQKNISGHEALYYFKSAPRPALIVLSQKNNNLNKTASRLLSLDEEANIKILRN